MDSDIQNTTGAVPQAEPAVDRGPEYTPCGAKTRSGGRCARRPAVGRTRCRLHGGASPVGPAHPRTTHGRYSKYFPGRLRSRYLQAEAEDLLDLRAAVAVLDVRVKELLPRLGTGEHSGMLAPLDRLVASAKREFDSLRSAMRRGTAADVRVALDRLEAMITHTLPDALVSLRDKDAAWRDVSEAIHDYAKVSALESKRLIESQRVLTPEQAILLASAIADAINRHVTDSKQKAAVTAEIVALMDHKPRGAVVPPPEPE